MFGQEISFDSPTKAKSAKKVTFANPSNPVIFGKSSSFELKPIDLTTSDAFGQNTESNKFKFGEPKAKFSFGQKPIKFGHQSQMNKTGTATTKFQSVNDIDTVLKNGQTTNVNTRHQCITAMKQYEKNSLEELRLEDYMANRKGAHSWHNVPFGKSAIKTTNETFTECGFGSSAGPTFRFGESQQPSTSIFDQPSTLAFGSVKSSFDQQKQPITSLFGSTHNAQANTSLFGQPPISTGFGTKLANEMKPLFTTSNVDEAKKSAQQNESETNPNSIILTFSKLEIQIPNGANSDPVSRSVQTTKTANDSLIQQLCPIIDKIFNQKK